MSALGGALAGVLVDKIGRVRTLQVTVATYTMFTVLCGFAPNFETLLVFRAFQGLGFGGEWAAGAILVAEYARSKYRGRAVAFVQSAWAVGWGLAVMVYTVVFQLFDEDVAWRVLFFTGALPALLIVWVRRNLKDPRSSRERRESAEQGDRLVRRDLPRRTAQHDILASLLATGVQGGYYTLASWLPTFLKTSRGLERRRHRRIPAFLISRRVPRLRQRRHLHRQARDASGTCSCSRRCRPSSWWPTPRCPRARTRWCSAWVPARLLHVGDLQRIRLVPVRAVPDAVPRHGPGLHVQLRPRGRRRVPGGRRFPGRDSAGYRRRDDLRCARIRHRRLRPVRPPGDPRGAGDNATVGR